MSTVLPTPHEADKLSQLSATAKELKAASETLQKDIHTTYVKAADEIDQYAASSLLSQINAA